MNQYQMLVEHFSLDERVATGKMFGMNCLKVNGNVFVSVDEELFILKLSQEDIAKASHDYGIGLFEPYKDGRTMREWVEVPFEKESVIFELAEQSIQFVAQIPPKIPKRK